jgi:hypothetical protein
MRAKVSQIITALLELQSRGYFDISLDYAGNSFSARIYKGRSDLHKRPVYYESIELPDEESKLDEVFNVVDALKAVPTKASNNVMITSFQCYRREFVQGEKSGKWIKILPIIEYGKNATYSRLIYSEGCYINDPDNGMQYYINYKIKNLLTVK